MHCDKRMWKYISECLQRLLTSFNIEIILSKFVPLAKDRVAAAWGKSIQVQEDMNNNQVIIKKKPEQKCI